MRRVKIVQLLLLAALFVGVIAALIQRYLDPAYSSSSSPSGPSASLYFLLPVWGVLAVVTGFADYGIQFSIASQLLKLSVKDLESLTIEFDLTKRESSLLEKLFKAVHDKN